MSQIRFALTAALACGLFGLTSGAFAQQSAVRDASIESDIERAQVLFEGGRADEALTLVNGVLDRAAGNAEARFLQGMIYVNTGRRDDAIDVFSSLTNDFPELPEPWNNLAVLFAENGEFDKARQALLAAIQTHPSYSTAHENLGDLYARMASMAYDRALEQDRGNESARLKLSAVNGLFTVPSQAPVQVAAAPAPAPVQTTPAPQPQREPEPEPEPEPAVIEPVTTAAVTRPPVDTTPEPAVQPQSVPEPPVAAAVPPGNPDEVAQAVFGWARAWSGQDVDGYLASYAPSFRPSNGASRASWNRYRRDRLTRPSFIQVDVSELSVDMQSAESAVAVFTQRYRSDNYEDQVRKTLEMVRVDGRWQISTENSQ